MLMRVIAVIHLSGNDDAVDFEGVGLPNLKRHARGLTASGSLAARLRKTDLREFLSLRKAQLASFARCSQAALGKMSSDRRDKELIRWIS